MFRKPFDAPTTVIIDPFTGLPLNIPLGRVTQPRWHIDFPDQYARVLELRREHGIEVEDDELVTGEPVIVDRAPGPPKYMRPAKRKPRKVTD